jgi:ribosomal-protein-alanine N-acetyltransferase
MFSLVEITTENYKPYLEQILEIEKVSFPSPWSMKAFKSEIQNKSACLWVLIEDQILSGYMCFWMFDSEIQLINIAVHPEKRQRGLGEYLLTKMIEDCISKAKHYIWLEVRPSNAAAKRLYQKMGFGEVGRRKRYYSDTNEDAIVMSLALPQSGSLHSVSN